MGSFDSFGLLPALLQGLARLGLCVPTAVQDKAIPLVLSGKDAIVMAKTGSGKTLAFGLPILSMLRPSNRPQALVVLPTRELAIQVCQALADVAQDSPLRTMAIYGGVGLGPQEAALRQGVDIVVGTPGRLKDLHGRGSLDLRQVSILVLDEADEMLDMGFRRDIEYLMDRLPARQQTLIFSATMPEAMETIARKHLTSPTVVRLTNDDAMPVEISHHFVRLQPEQRLAGLISLLRQEEPERAIIFTRMKHETKRLAQKLERSAGLRAGYLNGNMSQNARNRMMDEFRSGQIRFLVATDVAARGLHVDGLSHVVHYAVPTVVETYIHRSGRTGRAGQSGKTIIFVTPEAEGDFRSIRKQVTCEEILADTLGLESIVIAADEPAPASRQRRPQPAAKKGAGRGQERGATVAKSAGGASGPQRGQQGASSSQRGQGASGSQRGQQGPSSSQRGQQQGPSASRSAPAQASRQDQPQQPASRPNASPSRGGKPQAGRRPATENPGQPAPQGGFRQSGMADLWNQSYPRR
jgi:ATP-dependent RNA helicase RhlE